MMCCSTASAVNPNIKNAINFINQFCSSMWSKLFRDGAKISHAATACTVRLTTIGRSFQSRLFTLVEANTTSFGSYNTSGVLLCQHVEVHGHCSSNVVWSPISPSSPQIIPLSAYHFTGQHYFPNESALFWTDPNQKNIWGRWVDLSGTEVGKFATV